MVGLPCGSPPEKVRLSLTVSVAQLVLILHLELASDNTGRIDVGSV